MAHQGGSYISFFSAVDFLVSPNQFNHPAYFFLFFNIKAGGTNCRQHLFISLEKEGNPTRLPS
jgi:hypothetical protein